MINDWLLKTEVVLALTTPAHQNSTTVHTQLLGSSSNSSVPKNLLSLKTHLLKAS